MFDMKEDEPQTAVKLNGLSDVDSKDHKSHKNVKMGKGFRSIELVYRLVLAVLTRFWKLCTSAALILMLVFWMQGGLLTLFLFIFALIGKI